jgi:hypothetical protein
LGGFLAKRKAVQIICTLVGTNNVLDSESVTLYSLFVTIISLKCSILFSYDGFLLLKHQNKVISTFQGIELFACGVAWLILNAGAIFLCMWIKLKVSQVVFFILL